MLKVNSKTIPKVNHFDWGTESKLTEELKTFLISPGSFIRNLYSPNKSNKIIVTSGKLEIIVSENNNQSWFYLKELDLLEIPPGCNYDLRNASAADKLVLVSITTEEH